MPSSSTSKTGSGPTQSPTSPDPDLTIITEQEFNRSTTTTSTEPEPEPKENNEKTEPDFKNAKTSVWWDIENCCVPKGCDPNFIANNISSELVKSGYCGPVSISAYGNTHSLSSQIQHALNSTGVNLNHVPSGVKDASDKKILVDMLLWAIDNPAPANYLLISGDRDFANALHQLRMRRYNILLAQPPRASPALVSAASNVWLWTRLVHGSPTDSPSPMINIRCLQGHAIQCYNCLNFGHKKHECSIKPMNQPTLENKNSLGDDHVVDIPNGSQENFDCSPTDSPSPMNYIRHLQGHAIQCYNCLKFGHKKNECPSKPMNQPVLENKNTLCDDLGVDIPNGSQEKFDSNLAHGCPPLNGNDLSSLQNGNCYEINNNMVKIQEEGVKEVNDKKRKAVEMVDVQNCKKPKKQSVVIAGRRMRNVGGRFERVKDASKGKSKQDIKTQQVKSQRVYFCRICSFNHPGRDCKGNKVQCTKCQKFGHRNYECRVQLENVKEMKDRKQQNCQKCGRYHLNHDCEGNLLRCHNCGMFGHKQRHCYRFNKQKLQQFLSNMNNFCNNHVTNIPNASAKNLNSTNNEQGDGQCGSVNLNKNHGQIEHGSTHGHEMVPVSIPSSDVVNVVQGGAAKGNGLGERVVAVNHGLITTNEASPSKGLFGGVQSIFQTLQTATKSVSKFAMG